MNMSQADSMNPISLDTIVYHDPEMVAAPMDDELVMFSLERGMYYGLDSIASEIWKHLETPTSVAVLCAALIEEFEVDQETCQRETLELLNWLFKQELVKIGPAAS